MSAAIEMDGSPEPQATSSTRKPGSMRASSTIARVTCDPMADDCAR
jgi:hypothetical protein